MLTIKNLTSGYAGNEVLHDISLRVAPGEIVGLIGPNGAGKSTVLRSIFQLAQIKHGGVQFKENPITKLHTHDLLELGIGFVPQGRQVFSALSVEENLKMGGYLINNREILERNLQETLKCFPTLKEKLRTKARDLSGGQQQMLAIGRALMMTPQLLLLDEPSLGLSPKAIAEIVEILKQLNTNGTTLIIVEQNVRLLLKFATRVYVLAAGKIVAEDTPSQFHDLSKLHKLYFQEN